MRPISIFFVFIFTLALSACDNRGTLPPMPEALDALNSDDAIAVTYHEVDSWKDNNFYYSFAPRDMSPEAGFIIYPGGKVDMRAYAPTARAIAARGFFVALLGAPGELALMDADRGQQVIDDFPEIAVWATGGHSLGGTTACAFAKNADKVSAVVVWDSYPSGIFSLANTTQHILSIYGTNGTKNTPEDFQASAKDYPSDARFLAIDGGVHTYFGYYGDGTSLYHNENPTDLSREEQQSVIIEATASFLAGLAPAPISRADEAWCAQAQQLVEGYSEATLPAAMITTRNWIAPGDFQGSKPDFSGANVNTHNYFRSGLLESSGYEQVWCKLKTSAHIEKELGISPEREQSDCSTLSAIAIEQALERVSPSVKAAYEAQLISLHVLTDNDYQRGDQWTNEKLSFSETAAGVWSIQSPSLRSAEWIPLLGGMRYCKSLSPSGAEAFVHDISGL